MDFTSLQFRLVAHIRKRVRSGEWTERGLARVTGISQPHVHNVLKGARLLSPELADQFLRHLRLDLVDLLEPSEVTGEMPVRIVPVTDGSLGPGHPFPSLERAKAHAPVWTAHAGRLTRPALVQLAPDPQLGSLFGSGDMALVECDHRAPGFPDPDAWYALDLGGEGLVRRLRLDNHTLALFPPAGPHSSNTYVSVAEQHILDIVKAKVVWIGRNVEPPSVASRPTEETGTID
ncbi:MAG: helix-turn-helix domain-containing protein [Bryobacteraceae bacterium]